MHSIHHKELDVNIKGRYRYNKRNDQQGDLKFSLKTVRDPNMVVIRNKFTKEIVDLEVCTHIFWAQNLSFVRKATYQTPWNSYEAILNTE